MPNLKLQLARRMIALRGDRSQLQFSKEIGLSKSTLSRLEAGTQNITLATLETLCKKLRCRVADLFEDE